MVFIEVKDNKPKSVSSQMVEQLGRRIVETVFQSEQERANAKYREAFEQIGITPDTVKEATLTVSGNTSLYSTVVASFIEKAFRPDLIAEKIIKKLNLDMKGHNSIEVPKGSLLTAGDIAADGTVPASDVDYGGLTITIGWKGARTTISHQLLSIASVDLMADKLEEIGYAISRQVDSDIIAEMIKAGTKGDSTYGDNSNYSYLGSGTYIDYDTLVDAISAHEDLYAKPKAIVVNPTDRARILKDTDIKSALAFGTTPSGTIMPSVLEVFDMKLISTPQMTAGKIALVDTDRLGYMVDATDIETWDGRLQTTISFEVVGAKAYGVGITRPEAVYIIHENEAEPT